MGEVLTNSQIGGRRNIIINGAMQVAQRATSSTDIGGSSGYFTCDRWHMSPSGTAGRLTMTQDSSAPSGFANSIKLDCTTADTSIASSEFLLFTHKFEGQDVQSFAKGTSDAKQFSLSFYVKGNASATYVAELMDEDNSNRHVNKSFSVTTDWTRVELLFPADTTGTLDDDNALSFSLNIWLHAGSDFTSGSLQTTWGALSQTSRAVGISSFFSSTDNTFFITGVQLEVGSQATPFEHRSFGEELQLCKRYYNKVGHDSGNLGGMMTMFATRNSTNQALLCYPCPVPLRAAPSISKNGSYTLYGSGTSQTLGDILSVGTNQTLHQQVTFSATASGIGTGNSSVLFGSGADCHFEFDSEL
tara:strand:- start:206 stop:1282 length:1077 start_codon:yes stop_codon:yes gene_type:complete